MRFHFGMKPLALSAPGKKYKKASEPAKTCIVICPLEAFIMVPVAGGFNVKTLKVRGKTGRTREKKSTASMTRQPKLFRQRPEKK